MFLRRVESALEIHGTGKIVGVEFAGECRSHVLTGFGFIAPRKCDGLDLKPFGRAQDSYHLRGSRH